MNVVRARKFDTEPATATRPKPLVSIIVPAYNEAEIIMQNLTRLHEYLRTLEANYRWELIIVNDGSADDTGALAEAFAHERKNVRVLHHTSNLNLGQALRTAFRNSRGDYVVTMDIDLSYAPEHIPRMLEELQQQRANIVLASPYMEGGSCTNVPWDREVLSRQANRYLSRMAPGKISTLTGMVRAYEGPFVRALKLKATGMEINTEIIYKAQLLNARIAEIPGHLHWETQKSGGVRRGAHIKILRQIGRCLVSGFMFRPAFFLMLPALLTGVVASWALGRMFWEVVVQYQVLTAAMEFAPSPIGSALAAAFQQVPHMFWLGGLSALAAMQFFGFGLMALQNKQYFEELFHFGAHAH